MALFGSGNAHCLEIGSNLLKQIWLPNDILAGVFALASGAPNLEQ